VLAELRALEAGGTHLILCKTCLVISGLMDKVAVRRRRRYGDIIAAQLAARKVITVCDGTAATAVLDRPRCLGGRAARDAGAALRRRAAVPGGLSIATPSARPSSRSCRGSAASPA